MALYHTHRPQTFDTVIGQEPIITTIKNQVLSNKVAHAYLFSGPRGVGKTTTARVLAKAVNCPQRKQNQAEACNQCDVCADITSGRSIDVIEIDAASHTGVDSVRENIIDNVQFRPTKLRYKVFIIDEVHMLSTSAFNALLKTLEEPPAYIIFILATTELNKLPATIVSRCQRFHFKKVPYATLRGHVLSVAKQEGITVDEDVIDRIINKSDGCVRDAISLLEQIMATGEKHITADVASLVLPTTNIEDILGFLEACIHRNVAQALTHLHKISEEGVHFSQFANDCLELLRYILVFKAGATVQTSEIDVSAEAKKRLEALASHIDAPSLVRLTDLILKRRADIKSSPLPQLPLEMAAIEWCSEAEGTRNKEQSTKNENLKAEADKPDDPHLGGGSGTRIQVNIPAPQAAKEKQEKKAVKKSIAQKVKEVLTHQPACTQQQASMHWQACKEVVSKSSPSLAFLLNTAKVRDISGHTITISVPYAFHKDKLETGASKKELEAHLSKGIGVSVILSFVVETQNDASANTQELQELASAFGGEVVH